VGYVAQQPPLDWTQLVAAGGVTAAAAGTAYAQRILSTPARRLRRRTLGIRGTTTDRDGTPSPLDRAWLLAPLEGALRALSWAIPLLAIAVLLTR
nr:hypothetical protein [Nocardioidaceae bacterium]